MTEETESLTRYTDFKWTSRFGTNHKYNFLL